MPEEKSKMHPLLKAYAKKRQDEAPPLEMHPATRKLLQGEVAQVFGKNPTSETPKKPAWFSLFWPRFALAACLAIVAGVLIFSQSRNQRRFELAQNQPIRSSEQIFAKPAKEAAESRSFARTEVAENSNQAKQSILPQAAESSASEDRFEMRQKKSELGARRSLAATGTAPAPAEKISSAAPAADSAVAEGKARSLNLEDLSKLKRNRVQGPKHFKFSQENDRAKYRQNLQSPPPPKVLNSFEIEFAGNHVAITDADGSIYRGQILEPDTQDMDLVKNLPDKTEQKPESYFAANQPGSMQFRVSGTNKELQQLVVFTGTFRTSDFSNNFATGDLKKPETNSLYSETAGGGRKATNAIISGTAAIGGTNEFQLRATQIAP